MRPKNAGPNTSEPRSAWEAPAFTKLPIAGRTKSPEPTGPNMADDGSPRACEPKEPGQPLSKLGFSFEMALPMSSRSEK
jgi:hypothetical protein